MSLIDGNITLTATPNPGVTTKVEGFCLVKRWYVHMVVSLVVFASGILTLLGRRAVKAVRHRWCLDDRPRLLIAAKSCRVNTTEAAAAASSKSPRGHTLGSKTTQSGWRQNLREFGESLVSPNTTAGRVCLVLNFLLSMTSVAFYAYEASTWIGRVEHCFAMSRSPLMIADLAFSIFFLVRFCLRFLAAQSKLLFWVEFYSIVDFCTVPTAFVGLYLQQYWLGLRFLRALHIMSLPGVLQQINLVRSGSTIRSLQLVSLFLCVWFLGASAVHMLENSGDPPDYYNGSGVTFGDCLYFTIVTMSTVGYGDISPKTNLGRAFISMYILVALSIFASYTPEIAGMVKGRNRYAGSFTPEHGRKHIVVCGAISRQSVETFLKNLLHKDRKLSKSLEVVCVGSQKPDLEFQGLLKTYYTCVTFLEGTILSTTDCRRASLSTAEAAVVLASQYSNDPDEADAENTMRAVSIKNAAPKVRCIVQLLRDRNKRRLECIPNWDWRLGDECVCSSELKLGLLAQSCVAPGFSTLMANLFATRSMPTSGEAWQLDYHRGSASEIYSEVLGPAFHGMTFVEAASVCHIELGITLLAVMVVPDQTRDGYVTSVPRLLLNPSDQVEQFVIPTETPCHGYFLADSQQEVQQVQCLDSQKARVALVQIGDWRAKMAKHQLMTGTQAPPKEQMEHLRSLDPSGTTHWRKARELEEALVISNHKDQPPQHQFSGHYILCIVGSSSASSSSSQAIGLGGFIAPLRSRAYHRQDLTPIVIVGELSQLHREWDDLCHFPEIYIVPGTPMSRLSLRTAGIERCDMCVVISGNCGKEAVGANEETDPYLVDREVVMCTLNIKAMELPGGSDFYYRIFGLKSQPARSDSYQEQPQLHLCSSTLTEVLADKNIQYLEQDDEDTAFNEVYTTEGFACGSAFAVSVLDSLLATVFYNSSVMRLIRILVSGGSLHRSADEADQEVAGEAPSPTSRLTQLTMTDPRVEPYGYLTFGHLFLSLLSCHGILCFGVHRYKDTYGTSRGGGDDGTRSFSSKRVVIACPRSDFRMLPSDAVFALLPATSVPVAEAGQ